MYACVVEEATGQL